MKAAVQECAQAPLVLQDVPVPGVGPREVRVRVRACGVCHTDLHLGEGLFKTFGYDPFPLVPGHEIAGVVDEVGSDVTHVRCGDPVVVYWWHSCGRCRCCLAGEEESCLEGLSRMNATGLTRHGGYAEFVSVPAESLVPLPAEIEFAEAAPFSCAGLTVYAGLRNAGLRPGQRAAILGIGGLGHFGLQIARAMGAEVIALTSSEAKREIARRLGAHHVLPAAGREFGKQLRELGGADVVVSTTMDFQAIRDVLDGLRPQGTLVLASLTAGRLPIDPRTMILAQQRVMGTFLGSRSQLGELLKLAVLHGIRPVLEKYPLERVNEVQQRLRQNKVQFRAVLEP
ncbi:MAG: alcohol dehydrogenase catalytic domain-containing protein [Candidatus Anammoximicrobium sp.]|mgnify:CR=1 FL=1|nr:alcohol dehydrogenase catalytic domain-containing protein [Candidatus Anammoximicrobium sp.]